MSRRNRPKRSRRLTLDCLEDRRLLAASPDFYTTNSANDLYASPFFLDTAAPVAATTELSGLTAYDFRVDLPGDQTVTLETPKEPSQAPRLLIDPSKSYQFEFWMSNGDGSIAVEAFDASNQSLGMVSIPYVTQLPEGLNRLAQAHAQAFFGLAGRRLPAGTASIILSGVFANMRFGFVNDSVYYAQSDRSSDLQISPHLIPINLATNYSLQVDATRGTTAIEPQLHSLGYMALDADHQVIDRAHVQNYANAEDTQLARPLNPGDTTIVLVSAQG